MSDELRSISIFAKTVELGSFRAAAKALSLSPSVVSYHISKLEERYDIALLYRTTRKLSLTAEGQKLYDHASVITSASEACLNVLANESVSPSGKLTVSVPAILIESEILERIATFSKRYPKVHLSLLFTDARQDLVAEGIDVAIRIGKMRDSNLKTTKISSIERKLVCSPCYFQEQVAPSSPPDLNSWSWINLEMLPPSRTFTNDGVTIKTENKSTVTVNNVSASCQLSILGLGLSSPPSFLADKHIENGELIHVLSHWHMEDIHVYAVWPEQTRKESISGIFISHLKETS